MAVSKQVIQKIIGLLEKFPNDTVKHYASFKTAQIERFCIIGGLPVPANLSDYEPKAPNKLVKIDVNKLKRMVFSDIDAKIDYQEEVYTDDILNEQFRAMKSLFDDKHSTKYKIGDKLLAPKGNPNYYNRLIGDVKKGGQVKEGIFTAMKTVITGKY